MKLLLATLLLSATLAAAPHEEVLVIEELIATTQKNLRSQEALLQALNAYNHARDAYLADPDSSKRATLLVKRAMHLQSHLVREHLSHLFSPDFLTELAFYHQVGKNQLAGR